MFTKTLLMGATGRSNPVVIVRVDTAYLFQSLMGATGRSNAELHSACVEGVEFQSLM